MSKISCFTLIVIIFFQLSCGSNEKSPPPPPIRDFALMNENTVWVVSEKGKVFRLLGEGQKSEEIKFKTKVRQIYFLNANEGWIFGFRRINLDH